jgi:hypothetical protein
MSGNGNKHILFFSNLCPYSKEILSLITKKNLKDIFVFICIEKTQQQLPHFVDRVPLIYTSQRSVVTDESLFSFIESIQVQGAVAEDLSPFDVHIKANISDNFSFLEDDVCTGEHCKGYVYVNDVSHIQTPEIENKGSKVDSSILERYMSERDNDLKAFNMPRQF